MARFHDLKEGDPVTYFRPIAHRTSSHIGEVTRVFPGKQYVAIRFWEDGRPVEVRVRADNLQIRRDCAPAS